MDQQQTAIGRSPSGKFTKGHTIKSPGRPPKPKIEQVEYLALLRQALTEGESLAIIRKAIADAKGGSRHARQWLFSHVMPQFPRLSHLEFSILAPNGQMTISSPSGVYDDEDGVADDVYRAAMDELTEDELIAVTRFNDLRRRKRLELRELAQ